MKIAKSKLSRIIESFLSGPAGSLYIPDEDPYQKLDSSIKNIFSKEDILSDVQTAGQATEFDSALNPERQTQSGEDLIANINTYDNPKMTYDTKSYRIFLINTYYPEIDRINDLRDELQEEFSRIAKENPNDYASNNPEAYDNLKRQYELYKYEKSLDDKKKEIEKNLIKDYGNITSSEEKKARSEYIISKSQ